MYLSLLLLPLLSSFLLGLFGRFFGHKGSAFLSTLCIFFCWLLSCLSFYEIGLNNSPVYLKLGIWFELNFFCIEWSLFFDSLTSVMLFIITFVSGFVHLYSIDYMSEDPHVSRFLCYLSLFTFFMLFLVTADNFLQMFVGWEGVGLCSYLLINFWFTRIQANKAAIKAMVINRIGDFGLLLGIFYIFVLFSALDYATVFALVPQIILYTVTLFNFNFIAVDLVAFFLFVGAIGKSSQLGLHTWLPDAMEGPTPVSALIHAATMVTAGVFLLVRCSPLLEFSPKILAFVTIVGGVTAFFGSSVALAQNDIKKVIAYSTCSQLGYMIFACGISGYSIAIFHLVNHAFFKALLFLGAGSVIHAIGDEQDMRKMGGLKRLLPFTYAMMLIGSLSLMGIPFLSGFYSKDIILESSFVTYSKFSHFAFLLGCFAAFGTSFYSVRMLFLCFLSEPKGNRKTLLLAQENFWFTKISLAMLAFPSIFIGYYTRDLFLGFGTKFWGSAIFELSSNVNLIDAEYVSANIKFTPFFFSIFGIILFLYVYIYIYWNKKLFLWKNLVFIKKTYIFFNRKWFFDKIYAEFVAQKFLSLSYFFTYKKIDRGLIEILGPFGFSSIIMSLVKISKLWQSGLLYHYTLTLVVSFISFVLFFCFCFSFNKLYGLLLLFCLSDQNKNS